MACCNMRNHTIMCEQTQTHKLLQTLDNNTLLFRKNKLCTLGHRKQTMKTNRQTAACIRQKVIQSLCFCNKHLLDFISTHVVAILWEEWCSSVQGYPCSQTWPDVSYFKARFHEVEWDKRKIREHIHGKKTDRVLVILLYYLSFLQYYTSSQPFLR